MTVSILERYISAKRNVMVRTLSSVMPLIVVNEFPRSGGTWLSQMLGEASGFPFPRNQAPSFRPSIMQGHYLRPQGMRNVVLLWRDGRDVMLSLYHHCYFVNERHNAALVSIMKRELPFADYDSVDENLPVFMQRVLSKPLRPRFTWPEFVQSWRERDVVHVRYEDLLSNAVREIERIFAQLGILEVSGDSIRRAVANHAFSQSTGRTPGTEVKGRFARKGIAGDWKNHFNADAREVFVRYAGKELIALGYEADDDWVSRRTSADDGA